MSEQEAKAAPPATKDEPVVLDYPVEHAGETIKELKVSRRLLAKDFRGIKTDDIMFDDMLMLVSRLFGVPTSVVDKLDSTDFFKCVVVVNSFLPSGPKTGESR
jgi:tail assembly chaperone E/41/14-like protein